MTYKGITIFYFFYIYVMFTTEFNTEENVFPFSDSWKIYAHSFLFDNGKIYEKRDVNKKKIINNERFNKMKE